MSLLYVTVKRARLVGNSGQFNCYVTLKLQNVKSTTVSVKGNNPNWEQDFILDRTNKESGVNIVLNKEPKQKDFGISSEQKCETSRMDIGLIIEVWHKGMFWDKLVGTQWMPLTKIKYSNEDDEAQWLSLDTELVMENGEVVGTKVPTGHSLLLEAHFELACDLQDMEEEELMRKLELLNRIMDQEITCLREQDRRNYSLNSGVSEDSDYTSDVSYPIGHPSASVHHPNSSASQYGGVEELVHRTTPDYTHSREKSRLIGHENSCGNSMETSDFDGNFEQMDYIGSGEVIESDPLYYNSRPNYRTNSHSTERSCSIRSSGFSNSQEYESDMQYSFETDRNSQWNESQTIDEEEEKRIHRYSTAAGRRRSLERQRGFEHEDRYLDICPSNYTYNRSNESYPQDSFDSYQNDIESQVQPNWDKNARYVPAYNKSSPYYPKQWSNESEPSKNGSDWPKENVHQNSEPYENNRLKEVPPSSWQNDSLESSWPKSPTEDNCEKENEWNESGSVEEETKKINDVHSALIKPEWAESDLKKEDMKKNIWAEETPANEWVPKQMSNDQTVAVNSDLQAVNGQSDWLLQQDSIDDLDVVPNHVEKIRTEQVFPDKDIKLDFSHHSPTRESDVDETLMVNNKNKGDNNYEDFRRPSLSSNVKTSDQPDANNETEASTRPPESQHFVQENQSMSRAKQRWISAVSKIVSQLNGKIWTRSDITTI